MSSFTRREWLAATAAAPLPAQQKAPNVVFIFSDDHHYQCLGAAGNPHIRTPHLDRLAARGVNFSNGVITTSQCAPSRGVMLSGLETYQSGLLSNGQTYFKEGYGPTLIGQMRKGGYETVMVGKWHVRPMPGECGFSKAPLWLRGGSSKYQDAALRRGLEGKDETVAGHVTDLFTDAAIDSISQARRPFFLWLAYNAPHTPWYASEKYRSLYAGKDAQAIAPPCHPKDARPYDWVTYYSVITHLDEAVGRFIGALEKQGLWDNTLIFFLGDNGYLCGSKGLSGKVYPWEESVRIPFLAAGGMVKAGVRSDAPVASVDVCSTWMDYAGLKPSYALAGRSLRGYLSAGKGDFEDSFVTWADGRPAALTTGKRVEPYRLVRTRRHKYILWENRQEALFDWVADPHEEKNLLGDKRYERLRGNFRDRLRQRMQATADPALSWLA